MKTRLYLIVLLLLLVSSSFSGEPTEFVVNFDQPVGYRVLSLYSGTGEYIEKYLYACMQDDEAFIFADLPEGVWWLTVGGYLTNFGVNHVDAYKIVTSKEVEKYELEIPKGALIVDLNAKPRAGFERVWMHIRRYDGNELEPVYRQWVKMEAHKDKSDYFSGSTTRIRIGYYYLLTFYAANADYEKYQLGSVTVNFPDNGSMEKTISVSICYAEKREKEEVPVLNGTSLRSSSAKENPQF
jgi:hypothetical protein